MHKIICHTMYNQAISRFKYINQLLFIIKNKNNISKNQVIKIINQAYNIISKVNQIFIIALNKTIAININRSNLYTILKIDIQKTKISVQKQ